MTGRPPLLLRALVALVAASIAMGTAAAPSGALARPLSPQVAIVDKNPSGSSLSVGWIDAVSRLGSIRVAFVAENLVDDPTMRVELFVGDPTGAARRSVVTLRSGALAGVAQSRLDANPGTAWTDLGPATVARASTGSGVIDIELPQTDLDDPATFVWVTASRRAPNGSTERTITPPFSGIDLLGKGDPVSRTANFTWDAKGETPIRTLAGPSFAIDAQRVLWSFNDRSPTALGPHKVTRVEDLVRIQIDRTAADAPLYELRVDESTSEVRLSNLTDGSPIGLPADPLAAADSVTPDTPFVVQAKPPVGAGKRYQMPRGSLETALGAELTGESMVWSVRRITTDDGAVHIFGGVAEVFGPAVEGTDPIRDDGRNDDDGAGGPGSSNDLTKYRGDALRILYITIAVVVVVAVLRTVMTRRRERAVEIPREALVPINPPVALAEVDETAGHERIDTPGDRRWRDEDLLPAVNPGRPLAVAPLPPTPPPMGTRRGGDVATEADRS